jgi:hypothetical protein
MFVVGDGEVNEVKSLECVLGGVVCTRGGLVCEKSGAM